MTDFDKYRLRGAYHWKWYEDEPWYKACVDKCVEFCKGSTLDVGCGEGVVSHLIAKNGYEVIGFDSDSEAIRLAREHEHDTYPLFETHDINKPIDGKFEYMVCLNVIEHLEKPERVKEIFNRNITKAAIIITDIPQETLSSYHVHEFTPYELKQMFHTRKVMSFKIDDDFHGIMVYK